MPLHHGGSPRSRPRRRLVGAVLGRTPAPLYSLTKSFTSVAVGLAIGSGSSGSSAGRSSRTLCRPARTPAARQARTSTRSPAGRGRSGRCRRHDRDGARTAAQWRGRSVAGEGGGRSWTARTPGPTRSGSMASATPPGPPTCSAQHRPDRRSATHRSTAPAARRCGSSAPPTATRAPPPGYPATCTEAPEDSSGGDGERHRPPFEPSSSPAAVTSTNGNRGGESTREPRARFVCQRCSPPMAEKAAQSTDGGGKIHLPLDRGPVAG